MKISCPFCPCSSSAASALRRIGFYYRKSDGRYIQRFRCHHCRKSFSRATSHPCFRQNKRHKNLIVRRLLTAGVSQREIARVLCLNRKTVVRKLLYWGEEAKKALQKSNERHPPATQVEFDDLETFEHTKCKPLSVTEVVEYRTRRIIGFEVSRMPAKGKLAAISRKKYGFRRDERPAARKRLFERVKPFIHPQALIRSDSNPLYPQDVKTHFPEATHQTVLGKRGAVTGQGELKKTKFDPLFSLNHTFAMHRANINRLIRKTWCTTKRPDRLAAHIAIYVMSHNERLKLKTH